MKQDTTMTKAMSCENGSHWDATGQGIECGRCGEPFKRKSVQAVVECTQSGHHWAASLDDDGLWIGCPVSPSGQDYLIHFLDGYPLEPEQSELMTRQPGEGTFRVVAGKLSRRLMKIQ